MSASSQLKVMHPLRCMTLLAALAVAGPVWADAGVSGNASQSQGTAQTSASKIMRDLANHIEVSGFLSLRGGRINSNDVTYANVMDTDWSFSKESVIGLQVKSRVSDKLTMSMQVKDSSGGNGVQMEWGYLEYAFKPDLKLRAGRLRVPGYMLSEYLDVGYAYPWVHVPYEVYGALPFSRYEGMDLRYWTSVGDLDIRINPYLGTTGNQPLSLGNVNFTTEDSQFAGLDLQATYDIVTFRAGYSRYWFRLRDSLMDSAISAAVDGVQLSPDMSPYISGVKIPGLKDYVTDVMVNGVLATAISSTSDPNVIALLQGEQSSLLSQLNNYKDTPRMNGRRKGEFYGVGLNIDNGSYQILSEWSHSAIDGAYPDIESGYIMLGYRFGNWMPNFTFAKMYTVNDKEIPYSPPLTLNPLIWSQPALAPVVTGANLYTDVLNVSSNIVRLEQQSYTLGLRWDPMPGMDVKADVSYVEPKNGSYGYAIPTAFLQLANSTSPGVQPTPLEPPKHSVTAMRLALDMVF